MYLVFVHMMKDDLISTLHPAKVFRRLDTRHAAERSYLGIIKYSIVKTFAIQHRSLGVVALLEQLIALQPETHHDEVTWHAKSARNN